VDPFAVHTLALIPKVDPLALSAIGSYRYHLPIYALPRTIPGTPATPDPAADPPYPPACHLGVVILRVAFKLGGKLGAAVQYPDVAGVEIVLIHGPVGM